jgi:hypothetical protein
MGTRMMIPDGTWWKSSLDHVIKGSADESGRYLQQHMGWGGPGVVYCICVVEYASGCGDFVVREYEDTEIRRVS